MRVRCAFDGSTNTFTIYDDTTNAVVGQAANDLNLMLQCQARGWQLINPPKRRRGR